MTILLTEILFIASILLFLTGFLGIVIRPIQTILKAIHANLRLRHLILSSALCFLIGFGIVTYCVLEGQYDPNCDDISNEVHNIEKV
jgi:hypothetical protein